MNVSGLNVTGIHSIIRINIRVVLLSYMALYTAPIPTRSQYRRMQEQKGEEHDGAD